ncbi:hypothetical protein C6P64_17080 [Malikia granosa]|uniref:Uncharacterized protein n=1 Tax=Malikia granosa TaxID=263067 RepID=A0A2S9K0H3_9BURK|nr:hypothetical protein C6P64_17080 [Malikia granosa]
MIFCLLTQDSYGERVAGRLQGELVLPGSRLLDFCYMRSNLDKEPLQENSDFPFNSHLLQGP